MTGTIAAAISDEEVLQANALASVTTHFVVLAKPEQRVHVILPIARITGIQLVKTPYPGLLAISGGLFVLAAAAFFSKEGDGAGIPVAFVAAFILLAYFGSRKGTVTFQIDSGATESVSGGVKDATALVELFESARALATIK